MPRQGGHELGLSEWAPPGDRRGSELMSITLLDLVAGTGLLEVLGQ